jgi:hypothetical protein
MPRLLEKNIVTIMVVDINTAAAAADIVTAVAAAADLTSIFTKYLEGVAIRSTHLADSKF